MGHPLGRRLAVFPSKFSVPLFVRWCGLGGSAEGNALLGKKLWSSGRWGGVMVLILLVFVGCAGTLEDRARKLARRAEAAWAEGRYEAAVEFWEKARALIPQDDALALRLAEAYGQRDAWEKGAALCREVLHRSPNRIEAWRQMAIMAMAFGRLDEALRAVETLKSLDPKGVESLSLVGDFHLLQGKAEAALQSYNEALLVLAEAGAPSRETFQEWRDRLQGASALDPVNTWQGVLRAKKAACLAALGRRSEAVRLLGAIAGLPALPFEVWTHVGRVWEVMGDAQCAARAYETAFAMNPSNFFPMVRRFRLALKENKFQDAEAALDRLEQAHAPPSVVGKLRTEWALRTGNPSQAAVVLNRLRSTGHEDTELRLLAAKVQLFQDRPTAALLILEKILDLEPNIPLAHYLTGLAHLRLNHVRLGQKAMIRALELQPSFAEPRLVLAATYYKLNEMEPARAHAQALAEQEPENPQARLLLALVAAEQGDVDEALRHIKALALLGAAPGRLRAIEALVRDKSQDATGALSAALEFWNVSPESPDAAWQAWPLLCRAGRGDEAWRRLEKARNRAPNSAAWHVLSGDLARCLGRKAEAEAFYREALDAAPKTPSAYRGLLRCEAGGKDTEEKIHKEFMEHMNLSPEPVIAWADHAWERGNALTALKILEEHASTHPDSGILANNLAWLYLESDQCADKALALAQHAYDRLPNRAEVLDTLGYAYFKKGLLSMALWYLSEARARDMANPWAAYHLGLLYAAQNDSDQARLHLQAALRLGLPPKAAAQASAIVSPSIP